ncbi:MAG: MoxR family ATPase [Gammaproteobacteria bacterium]|nr:MoxR family ATPase [Gammaproteobacteria bacterium]
MALAGQHKHSIEAVLKQLDSVIIGKPEQIRLALACLLARGHLLIEDMPGVGKTTLAHTLAATLGLPWKRVQFTSDLLPADIIGVSIFNRAENRFEFHEGPVFSSVLLADEVNRAPPKAQSALLEAMEERQISVDGETHSLPDPFFVIATLNPADRLGAYSLPESQLDRFLVGIALGYPDPEAERELLSGGDRRDHIEHLQPLCDCRSLKNWQNEAKKIHVAEPLLDYVQALLLATRNDSNIILTGLSPRAGLNLLALARAWAWMQGREMVLPEDVQAVFPSVAGHRLTGSVREGAKIAQNILDVVPVSKV